MSENLPRKILIVDNDRSIGQGMKFPLERHNIKVESCSDYHSALYMFEQSIYSVVVVELGLEPVSGLALAQKWRKKDDLQRSSTGIIVSAGNRNEHEPKEARLLEELQHIQLIYKPFTAIQLLPYLSRAQQQKNRAIKVEEICASVLNIARNPNKIEKAVNTVKQNLSELGNRGIRLMLKIYELHERWADCLAVIDPLLSQQPQNIALINAKGRILLKLDRAQEALIYLEKGDRLAPNHLERVDSMATAYLKSDSPNQSVKCMKQLIDMTPEDKDVKFEMFSRLYEYGYDEHAASLCKETATPIEVVRYYNNRGVALARGGKVEQAITEYERCLSFYPKFKENYRILFNIALAHASFKKRKNHELAVKYLNKCLELNSKFKKASQTKELILSQLVKATTKKSKRA